MARLPEIRQRGLDPGEFTTRVEFQRRVESVLPNGELQRTWATYAIAWCSVRTATAREFIAAEQSWPSSRRVLRTHFLSGVGIADRAVVDGVPYDIIGAADPYGDRAFLDVFVTEYAHDG